MAKKTRTVRKKGSAARGRERKTASARPTGRGAAGLPIPAASEVELAAHGIRADARNRYVNIEFANGYVVRLLPVGVSPKQVSAVRDLVVAFLNRALR